LCKLRLVTYHEGSVISCNLIAWNVSYGQMLDGMLDPEFGCLITNGCHNSCIDKHFTFEANFGLKLGGESECMSYIIVFYFIFSTYYLLPTSYVLFRYIFLITIAKQFIEFKFGE